MKSSLKNLQKLVILFLIIILFLSLSFPKFIFANTTYLKENTKNNIKTLYLFQPLIQRQETPKILLTISNESIKYKVEKNDTLYSISKKYNISIEELRKANNLKDKDILKIGMILIIPKKPIYIYSPADNFDWELKTDKILLLYLKSNIIFSPLANGEIIYIGQISGFGNSVIINIEEYNVVISNLEEILIQKNQKVNLQTCIGYSVKKDVLNISVFFKDKMLNLKDFLKK
ncbi:MAG TPA: LysM peptidoglycan-binding domain-containing protein [Exilispira sp.]|nr:LysM peptidoglycan-binding domain-containing protein [Exilispira sp.]